jgi:6-phosphofructokinase 2
MRILTLTVNPAIDLSTTVGRVVPERKLRCERPRREPGGGGINVSRAILRLGGTSEARYLAGGPTGDLLRDLLEKEGLTQRVRPAADSTRENVVVFDESSGEQYRFSMPGPEIRDEEWQGCLRDLEETNPAEYIVVSGSLPPGVPEDFYGRVALAAARIGARLVVDTSGAALRHAVAAGTYLLKPNVRELQDLTGEALEDEAQQERAARRLIEDGRVRVIVLSLGAGGALVISGEGRSGYVRSPIVPIRSKVGAGDSMVGGLVLGLTRGLPLMDAVRFGVAAGAAAVMTDGTELCRRYDVERLFARMPTE